jgi:hypothetical protein
MIAFFLAFLPLLAISFSLLPLFVKDQPRIEESAELETPIPVDTLKVVIPAGAAILALALVWCGLRYSQNAAQRRQPQRPEQAVWGLAAYYTGDNVWATLSTRNWSEPEPSTAPIREYRAARPEWLRLLVEANPNQADEETYTRVVGTPKPPAEAMRPFPK